MENNIFENPAHLNHYNVYEGMRVSESANRPSIYITCLKLRKAFKLFADTEIEEIYGEKMGILGVKIHRQKLEETLEDLHDWQLFYALYLLINEEGAFEAAKYIVKCRYDDVSPFKDEYELYKMICRK